MRHTKGDWKLSDLGEIECNGAILALVYGAEDYPCLDNDEQAALIDECHANGLLIASAPDLLEACEKARRSLAIAVKACSGGILSEDEINDHVAIKLLDRAIKKAKAE